VRKLAGMLLALTIVGGAVSCGDDDDAPENAATTTAQSITKQEFLTQANAICTAGSAEMQAALAAVTEATTEDELSAIITDQMVGSIRGQLADMRALGYPDGDRETLEGIYTDTEAMLDQVEADPIGLVLNATTDPFAELNARLAEYGLTACAE
jgi:hypothetical protein